MKISNEKEANIKRELIKLITNTPFNDVRDLILLQRNFNEIFYEEMYNLVSIDLEDTLSNINEPICIEEDSISNPNIHPTPFDDLTNIVPVVGSTTEYYKATNTVENDSLFVVEIMGFKVVITEYQYKKKQYTYKIEDTINLSEWTDKNSFYLNKFPELRDKLIMDQLTYVEFLTLEGFTDADPKDPIYRTIQLVSGGEIQTVTIDEPTPFDNVDGVLLSDLEQEEDQSDQEDQAIKTAKEVVERYDISNFMAEDSPAVQPTAIDNWVPEVVEIKTFKDDSLTMDEIFAPKKLVPVEAITVDAEIIEEPEVPKPIFNLTEHQQLKYDGLISTIEEIINKQRSLVRPPNAAYYMTVLEGAAGTGKTTMMKKVLETLLEKEYSIIFCSPTHQALGVIRETLKEAHLPFTESNDDFIMEDDCRLIIKTLASFLGIKMKRDLENGTESFETDPRAPILTCDILAIDESSMVSKDQLRILLQKLHINVRCILYIGDEVQLDSPSDNNESNGIFTLPQKYSLEEVVRQAADSKILPLAWEIRSYILNKYCPYLPSQLLHPGRTNENIIIIKDQTQFINHYIANESESKLISTYTNKITNEYNNYIRHLRLTGVGKPLDINIDGNGKNICVTADDYKEMYIGEELVVLEPNQRNGEIIHQTGERIKILELSEQEKTILISVDDSTNLLADPVIKEFVIQYWDITDTKGRRLSVVKENYKELYNEVLALLSVEAKKATHKHKWAKYWGIKEKFVKVNRTYAFTLHKLQGSTCDDIYVDARDLDKFWQRMPVGVYKLIYIALTRPKHNFIVLI